MSTNDEIVFDLDRERALRAEARSKAGGAAAGHPIRISGTTYMLPAELPLDVFAPLVNINLDLALVLRLAMDSTDSSEQARREATSTAVDLLVANPNLPREVIAALQATGSVLMGEAAYSAFVAARPSREDVGEFAKRLFRTYGVSLGEASGSSEPSTDSGRTSKRTSKRTTRSTPVASTPDPGTPTSSASAG